MSRIGKQPITVPSGVDVTIDGGNVRVKGPNGFQDVKLDCMSAPLTGWKAIDSAGKYEMTNVNLIFGGTPQKSLRVVSVTSRYRWGGG